MNLIHLFQPMKCGHLKCLEPDYVVRKKDISIRKTEFNSNQKKVYDILKQNGDLSLQQVADKCGLSLSGVKKICSMLQENGFVERIGSKRDGHWVVK